MEFKDVNELLEKGFTPDQIVELAKSTNMMALPEEPKAAEPNAEVEELKTTISSLQETIKAIQSSNLKGATISEGALETRESASDILAKVFYGKGGN